jgi:hypothetical protein
MQAIRGRFDHLVGCGWFWAWAIVGAAFGLTLSSLGLLVLLPAMLVASLMAANPRIRDSAFGLLTGAGLFSLFIAYVQRKGPREVCWSKGMSNGCDTYLDPRPWLVAGIVFAAVGLVGHALRSHRSA